MDEQHTLLGNEKRATWRSSCRKRLSEHIWETLGIRVQPSEVRLKPDQDMDYRWHIEDPSFEPLFQKHLSKHSVGGYMLLQRDVGRKFYATRPEKDIKAITDINRSTELQNENLYLSEQLRLAGEKVHLLEEAVTEAENEIQSRNSDVRESHIMINLYQQDILNWMALCQWHESRSLHCSRILGEMVSLLQGSSAETPQATHTYS